MPNIQEIEELGMRALHKVGVPEANAALQMDLLIQAELRGYASHGLLRLPRIIERIQNKVADPVAQGATTWRAEALLDVDGQNGLGPVVATNALNKVSERARTTGVAVAAVRNCNHLGMLAWYVDRLARQGQVAIALTTSEALVHPWGGRAAMLGTNPIAVGVPAQPDPFVLDMATSLVSMGKIHDYANHGRSIPIGWALDSAGNPTTDPNEAKNGALAPFGEAKGYALGLAFEVLVASLTASALGRDVRGTLDSTEICNKGDLFIVMEPAPGVMNSVSGFLEAVRQSPPYDPAAPVLVPGDRSRRSRMQRMEQEITVAADVWCRITELADAVPVKA